LDLAITTAKEQLELFAGDAKFLDKMNFAFENSLQPQAADALIQELASGEAIPKIEIVPAANLKANGAFGEDTIYLSEEFLTKNVANPEAVAGVLLEEIGHYVDRELNSVDSPGDEGDLFARLLQGETIDGAELAALKTENDSATITLNEQETTVELADPLLFQDEVVRIANEQWIFFERGAKNEMKEDAWPRIVEYFQAANRPDVDTPEEVENTPWSAAFISWVMQEAGSGDEFIYSALHADYINQAIEDRESEAAFIAHPINEYSLQPGDLIGANRPDKDGSDGSDVIVSYDDAVDTGGYSSHVDIVVAIRPGEIDVIGGNVEDSVTLKTYKVDPEGKLTNPDDGNPSNDFFVVIENRLGDVAPPPPSELTSTPPYKDYIVHEGTPIGVNPAATQFLTGDYDGDGKSDLFSIVTEGTGTNSTEVHVLSGASNYQDWIVHEGTPIGVNPSATQFLTGDYDGDGKSDLFSIVTEGTGTNSTEVHVLSGGIDDANATPLPTDSTPYDATEIINSSAVDTEIRQYAETSVPLILTEAEESGVTDPGQIAYILATADHESLLGKYLEELASGEDYEGREDLGNTEPGDGPRFKGRGYVQITGRNNYTDWSEKLGVDLVGNPELAADPEIAATILVEGMRDGSFTGFGLSDYISGENRDFVNARRIVNGVDKAEEIAQDAERYYQVLTT
jgi:predicted chitinase